jgi:hypothetical protein
VEGAVLIGKKKYVRGLPSKPVQSCAGKERNDARKYKEESEYV